ncbi:TrwC relaxase [Streptomyces avidinii]|nr:TrwC relaxase [Streptomyces avidinii]SNX80875.1 TrwC relaxase [Streptomyces microflavus]
MFRDHESRAAESKPLLHDHAVVSIRARRPDAKGTWGNLSVDTLLSHIVAADTLYLLFFMEEVSARLGWAWEPREVTPGRRPVMEITGIDQRLIGWQSTRRQQIEEALFVLTAEYVEEHGHAPGERAAYGLACRAADRTRPPKRKEPQPLSELRERWRESALALFGADVIDRLAQRARAAAAAVWARVRPVVDVALAAVDVVAVVYVMRGAFKRHHLLAEARRYLSYVLRGQPHQRGLDEQIVQAVIDDYTRPVGRGLMMTADLHALYPRDTDDQAVLRPLTRKRTAPPYERARLAAGALASRGNAARRAERLGSRTRPYAVAVSAASSSHPRPFRAGSKAGRLLEQATGVDTVERTRQTMEAAAAQLAATIQDSKRAREAAYGLRPQPPRPRRRTPSSPASSTRRAEPQEESREHPGRTARPPRRPRPRVPREDGRRARRGPGARARRARGVAAGLEAAPDTEVEDGEEASAAQAAAAAPGRREAPPRRRGVAPARAPSRNGPRSGQPGRTSAPRPAAPSVRAPPARAAAAARARRLPPRWEPRPHTCCVLQLSCPLLRGERPWPGLRQTLVGPGPLVLSALAIHRPSAAMGSITS